MIENNSKINILKLILTSLIISFGVLSTTVWAGSNDDILSLQKAWMAINYQTAMPQQARDFENLLLAAKKTSAQYTELAEAHIWQGVIEATYADLKNDVGDKSKALSLAESAKNSFKLAIKLNPHAMNGAAYTNLGALYYQVPGWPLGFGDEQKAEEFLLKGLAHNPDDIDANFFYGDFLFQKAQLLKAQQHLIKASLAPERDGREVADKARKQEIKDRLKQVSYQLTRHQ